MMRSVQMAMTATVKQVQYYILLMFHAFAVLSDITYACVDSWK